ncbi:MAG: IclR family transcriptional regulator [Streptosporangiales bacterium]|nr:IclR family transcriptional regulator [Streptosporangiales bacterium]
MSTGRSGSATSPERSRSGVQSIDRAVALLRCFTPQRPRLGVSALARLTGLSTSTTFRLLAALQANGVVRQVNGPSYELGPLLLQLADTVMSGFDLRETALPVMRALRDATDETVGLHVLLPNLTRSVVDQAESRQPLRRTYTEIGEPIPLHQGAPGKLLLAHLPERDLEEVLSRPHARATPSTPIEPDELRALLPVIRERGYSISLGERVPGIRTVAAAIRDHTGRVMASLSVSGPEIRMPEERLHEIGALTRESAGQISHLLGAADE